MTLDDYDRYLKLPVKHQYYLNITGITTIDAINILLGRKLSHVVFRNVS